MRNYRVLYFADCGIRDLVEFEWASVTILKLLLQSLIANAIYSLDGGFKDIPFRYYELGFNRCCN